MTRRIQKKRALRRDIEDLRAYVTGKPHMWIMWRLLRLREWGPPPSRHLSRSKARRMLRARDRQEMAQMRGMIGALTQDMQDIEILPSKEKPASGLHQYDLISSWAPAEPGPDPSP